MSDIDINKLLKKLEGKTKDQKIEALVVALYYESETRLGMALDVAKQRGEIDGLRALLADFADAAQIEEQGIRNHPALFTCWRVVRSLQRQWAKEKEVEK
jgi:hypothetical protein